VILAVPHQDIATILNAVHDAQLFYAHAAAAFVIGAYMTIAGVRRT
jgi:hypothetical protein